MARVTLSEDELVIIHQALEDHVLAAVEMYIDDKASKEDRDNNRQYLKDVKRVKDKFYNLVK